MSKTQSKQLTEFYQAYKLWLDEGSHHDLPFLRNQGLCGAVKFFYEANESVRESVRMEMTSQFQLAKLPTLYPFNKDSATLFLEMDEMDCHNNLARVRWVEAHACIVPEPKKQTIRSKS